MAVHVVSSLGQPLALEKCQKSNNSESPSLTPLLAKGRVVPILGSKQVHPSTHSSSEVSCAPPGASELARCRDPSYLFALGSSPILRTLLPVSRCLPNGLPDDNLAPRTHMSLDLLTQSGSPLLIPTLSPHDRLSNLEGSPSPH